MNIVTIHPQPKKPLTFGDIPPGPFFFASDELKTDEFIKPDTDPGMTRAYRRRDGRPIATTLDSLVTLPDAPPQQDDTVLYRDIDRSEAIQFVDHTPGDVWIKGTTDGGAALCLNLRTGRILSMSAVARVRRVHSFTYTREDKK